MLDWVSATIFGLILSLGLYGCVRLRMHFGPIVYRRYGTLARHVYWVVTIVVMVLIANLGLMLLRIYLGDTETHLMLEIWFALVALGISLILVFRQLRSDNCQPMIKE
jgi:hypothetical protein